MFPTNREYILSIVLFGIIIISISITELPNTITAKTLETLLHESEFSVDHLPSLKVGQSPTDVEVDASGENVYVSNAQSQTVSAININTMRGPDIRVGKDPSNIEFGLLPYDRVFVANSGESTVSVIGIRNNTEIQKIRVGEKPVAMAIDDDNRLYVANSGENTVSVINGTNYSQIRKIPVGISPTAILVFHDKIYVANSRSGTVSVISGINYTEVERISVGLGPVAISNVGPRIFVVNSGSNDVSVINGITDTEITKIPVGWHPMVMAVDDSSDRLYVANSNSTISVIDSFNFTQQAMVTLNDLGGPSDIAVWRDKVYVTYKFSDVISVISTDNNSEIVRVRVGKLPMAISFDDIDGTVYVANSVSNTVSVINGKTDKLMVGVSFDVNPFHGGRVICNPLTVPTDQYFFVDFKTHCTGQSNKGFQFTSWLNM